MHKTALEQNGRRRPSVTAKFISRIHSTKVSSRYVRVGSEVQLNEFYARESQKTIDDR